MAARDLNALAATSEGRIKTMPLDVAKKASVEDCAAKLGNLPIDLLICNAGISGPKPPLVSGAKGERIQDFDDEKWFEVLRTNLLGPVRVVGLLADNVSASSRKTIGFITTRMANIEENKDGAFYMYRASKGALNTAIKNLSLELGKRGVTCIGLHPGWVRTDFSPAGIVEPEDSARGLLNVMINATAAENGRFIDYTGERVPW